MVTSQASSRVSKLKESTKVRVRKYDFINKQIGQ